MIVKRGAIAPLLLLLCSLASAQTPPTEVDWRTKGAVTPVKNEGQCGSSYAFAAVAAVEGAHKIMTGQLVTLSEQEVVDCSHAAGNQGCNGGWPELTLTFIQEHGLTSESQYPYTARDGVCRTATPVVRINGWHAVAVTEAALLAAVAKQPVVAVVDASGAFQSYRGGVLTSMMGSQGNHCVTIVGYGTYGSTPYWLAKNSWGTTWGESGYIRMARTPGRVLTAVAPNLN
jgi:KDEL-tailed cysteine endopeptidase